MWFWFDMFGLLWFGQVWFGMVWSGEIGMVGLVGFPVTLKLAKANLELYLGTIPAWVRSDGSNSDYEAISVQLKLQLPAGKWIAR